MSCIIPIGLVVEHRTATWETRVQFPVGTYFAFLSVLYCFDIFFYPFLSLLVYFSVLHVRLGISVYFSVSVLQCISVYFSVFQCISVYLCISVYFSVSQCISRLGMVGPNLGSIWRKYQASFLLA